MATREGAAESDGDAGVGGVRRDGDGGADGAAGRPAAPTSPYVIISFDIGVKNLACCVLALDHVPQATARPAGTPAVAPGGSVLHWTVYSLAAEKERIPSVNELSGRLFMVLDEFVADLEARGIPTVEMVLLENQPSRLNGAMKSIQMIVQCSATTATRKVMPNCNFHSFSIKEANFSRGILANLRTRTNRCTFFGFI